MTNSTKTQNDIISPMKRCVILARVSSKEQELGFSLDAQEKLATDYAHKLGFEFEQKKDVFRISESASGKQVRKTYNKMFAHVTKNKIPVLLCEKIDRLTRNPKDAVLVQDWINEDENRAVHFIKENFILNRNTRAHENLVWDMKVAIARFYTNNLSEEVRKGQNEKLSQGLYPGSARFGYKNIGEEGHKLPIPEEPYAKFVKQAFNLYDSGNYSIEDLVSLLYKEGFRSKKGKKITRSTLHRILNDSFYHGVIAWKGRQQKGVHEPLIAKELFDRVQQKLNRKGGAPQYQKHLHIFTAKMTCGECGGRISWYPKKGHLYGECKSVKVCSQKGCVRQEKIEEQLLPMLDKVAPKNERVLNLLERALKESHSEEIDFNTAQREQLNQIIRRADQRMEKAYEDKLDGIMPVMLCEKAITDAAREKEEAVEALNKLGKSRKAYYEAGFAIHELASKAASIYLSDKATLDDKRMLLSYAFSNLSLRDGKITPKYTLAFEFLLEWIPQLNNNFEPENDVEDKGNISDFVDTDPVLRKGRDSNPRYHFWYTVFPGLPVRPLRHLSIGHVILLIVRIFE